jgi:hypothetical protein
MNRRKSPINFQFTQILPISSSSSFASPSFVVNEFDPFALVPQARQLRGEVADDEEEQRTAQVRRMIEEEKLNKSKNQINDKKTKILTQKQEEEKENEGEEEKDNDHDDDLVQSLVNSLTRIVAEKLTCPICNMTLLEPVVTPCMHVFCRPCIARRLNSKRSPRVALAEFLLKLRVRREQLLRRNQEHQEDLLTSLSESELISSARKIAKRINDNVHPERQKQQNREDEEEEEDKDNAVVISLTKQQKHQFEKEKAFISNQLDEFIREMPSIDIPECVLDYCYRFGDRFSYENESRNNNNNSQLKSQNSSSVSCMRNPPVRRQRETTNAQDDDDDHDNEESENNLEELNNNNTAMIFKKWMEILPKDCFYDKMRIRELIEDPLDEIKKSLQIQQSSSEISQMDDQDLMMTNFLFFNSCLPILDKNRTHQQLCLFRHVQDSNFLLFKRLTSPAQHQENKINVSDEKTVTKEGEGEGEDQENDDEENNFFLNKPLLEKRKKNLIRINDDECPICLSQIYTSGLLNVGPLVHLIREWKTKFSKLLISEEQKNENEQNTNRAAASSPPPATAAEAAATASTKMMMMTPEILILSSSSSSSNDDDDNEDGTKQSESLTQINEEHEEDSQMTQILLNEEDSNTSNHGKKLTSSKVVEKIREVQERDRKNNEGSKFRNQVNSRNDNFYTLTPKLDMTKIQLKKD